jgi:hypothetical protein
MDSSCSGEMLKARDFFDEKVMNGLINKQDWEEKKRKSKQIRRESYKCWTGILIKEEISRTFITSRMTSEQTSTWKYSFLLEQYSFKGTVHQTLPKRHGAQ